MDIHTLYTVQEGEGGGGGGGVRILILSSD